MPGECRIDDARESRLLGSALPVLPLGYGGLQTRQVASATLYTEGSGGFVASTAASIAAGWSDPVPGWDLHPLLTSAFHGAHETGSSVQLSPCSKYW